MPFHDATGRHGIEIGPDFAAVQPAFENAPDGQPAARFAGGWLDLTNIAADSGSDFAFDPARVTTLELWFKSDVTQYDGPNTTYPKRIHAIGFGDNAFGLTVRIDYKAPITVSVADVIGSTADVTVNSIGRASPTTREYWMSREDYPDAYQFAWYGLIAGVRVSIDTCAAAN